MKSETLKNNAIFYSQRASEPITEPVERISSTWWINGQHLKEQLTNMIISVIIIIIVDIVIR